MIQRIIINKLKAISKPRGQLNKAGKITHSIGKYRDYQKKFLTSCKMANLAPIQYANAVAIHFSIKPSRGRKQDLDNLAGGVLDTLKEGKYIDDDNWGIIPILLAKATPALRTENDSITVYITDSPTDFLYVVNKFFISS